MHDQFVIKKTITQIKLTYNLVNYIKYVKADVSWIALFRVCARESDIEIFNQVKKYNNHIKKFL